MTEENKFPGDHDLLVEIKTKLERVISDVATISQNLIVKVEKLEYDKAEKEEMDKLHGDTLTRLSAIDKDISLLQKWRAYMLGMMGVISFVIAFLLANWDKLVR